MISNKTKKCFKTALLSVLFTAFALFLLPVFFGVYYFSPAEPMLPDVQGIIQFDGERARMYCAPDMDDLPEGLRNSTNRNLYVFKWAGDDQEIPIRIKRRFLWILWQSAGPGWEKDNWHLELPCFRPDHLLEYMLSKSQITNTQQPSQPPP